MKKLLPIFLLSVLVLVFMPAMALAAKPSSPGSGKPGGGGGGSKTTVVGNDISWPQCDRRLPSGQAFGIVGVNGGLASTTNPCLADQLLWAQTSTGGTNQPKAQLYVNTANPGEVINQITTWPTDNTDRTGATAPNPYGQCAGGNDLACSWQYGWNRAVEDVVDRFVPAAQSAGVDANAANYTWWLDVETVNSWQSESPAALERNAATLEGMTAYFQSVGAEVGLYSTSYQWGVIAGSNLGATGNLADLDSWLPGAKSLRGAQANCTDPALTGGAVTLTQYVSKSLDYDYPCGI